MIKLTLEKINFGKNVRGYNYGEWNWIELTESEIEEAIDATIEANGEITKKMVKKSYNFNSDGFRMMFDKVGINLFTVLSNKLDKKIHEVKTKRRKRNHRTSKNGRTRKKSRWIKR